MEKYSFKSLFSKPIKTEREDEEQISKIEIPRIQRDYAQGRKEKRGENIVFNDKGLRFIESVFDKLKASEEMPLDFIYGALENGTLLPLDGQQRLTTLFLLYWYIGNRELENKTELTEMLRKFGYETRSSSRSFCEKLSSETISFKSTVSEELKDKSWFAMSYEQDPTIKSMLNMLDKIHELYGAEKLNLYEHLDKLQFNVLPLNHFNLTDELYVKMNARGKALTDFENFKANFVGWMKKKSQEKSVEFAGKLDNAWTDIFWKNRSSDGRIDDIYFAFLNRYFLNVAIVKGMVKFDQSKITVGEKYWYLYENDSTNYKGFELYSDILGNSDLTERIDTIFNRVKDIEVIKYLQEWMKSDFSFIPVYVKKDDVELVSNITQSQRVLFYAICRYFETGEFDEVSFRQWMRVVCNLIENTTINTIDAMVGRLKLIGELSEYSHNIYDFLANPETKIESKASEEQIREEIDKATKIKEDAKWEEKFVEAENYAFFNGAIRFLFTNEKGETDDWGKYDLKWENAQKYFDEKGVISNLKDNAILLRNLVKGFNKWGQFWKLVYDGTKENWKQILTNSSLVYPVSNLLSNIANEDELSEFESSLDLNEYQKSVHTEMVRSLLLSTICDGCKLVWRSDWAETYALYPHNCRKEEHFYLFNKRNEILQDNRFICNQKLSNTNFFWGKDVIFEYNSYSFRWQHWNWVDMYDGDEKLYDKGGDYKTLHTQFNGDTKFAFTDSNSLIKELDRCISEYNNIK